MSILNTIRNNTPFILTGMAIFGVALCAVETAKATPKAVHILEEEEIDVQKDPVAGIKACWKCYIYPAGIFAGTMTLLIIREFIHEKDYKKVLAALAYSEAKHQEYLAWEKGMFGPQYPAQAEESIRSDRRARNDIPNDPLREGMMWCYEPESDQWFQTNTEQILWVELTANKMFANQERLTFNQYLSLYPYAKHNIEGFDYYGWYKYDDDGYWDYNWSFYRGGTPWIDIQPQINTSENYMVLKYGMHPGDDPDCNDLDIPEEPEQFIVDPVKS